jgi:hypothetical protein
MTVNKSKILVVSHKTETIPSSRHAVSSKRLVFGTTEMHVCDPRTHKEQRRIHQKIIMASERYEDDDDFLGI